MCKSFLICITAAIKQIMGYEVAEQDTSSSQGREKQNNIDVGEITFHRNYFKNYKIIGHALKQCRL